MTKYLNNSTFKIFWYTPSTYLIKKILKNSIYFVIFSFLNVIFPIVICLISANMAKDGAYAAMGIGYVTTFLMAFSQVGFSFAIFSSIFYFKFLNNRAQKLINHQYDLVYDTIFLALIYGTIITPIYVASSYVYTKYASAHYNTIDSLEYAYDFIYSSAPYVFLITVLYTFIMLINLKKGQLNATIHLIFAFGLMTLLSYLLGTFTDLKGMGVGLGISIGAIICISTTFYHCYQFTDLFKNIHFRIRKHYVFLIFSFTWKQALITLSIQVFKGCALLLLNYQIPDALVDSVPLDYQMSRMIWYNMMYFIPFVFLGFADSIYFFFIKETDRKWNEANINLVMIFIGFIILLITIALVVIGNEMVKGLSKVYTFRQDKSYDDALIIDNLKNIGASKIIEILKEINTIDDKIKQLLIKILEKNPDYVIKDELIQKILLSKFNSFSSENIEKLLIFPKSFTYFYLASYCILYPLGQYMNAFNLSLRNKDPNAILLVIAQAVAILFVVEFGINFQTTPKFYLMEAWSFPLLIIGIVALIYLSFKSFLGISAYQKKNFIIKNMESRK